MSLRSLSLLPALSTLALAQTDWRTFGSDPGALRFSPLSQINTTSPGAYEV